MRPSFASILPLSLRSLLAALIVLGLALTVTTPAHAESHVLMQNAMDLIHKAWNPGGKTPSTAQRTKWLKQAMQLLSDDPYRGDGNGYTRDRMKAMRYVRAAMIEMDQGDPYKMVPNYLQDAEDACRSALSDG